MHKRTDLATRARVLSDQASQKAVLDALRSGMSTSSASSLVGITREALRLYRKTDPDFHQACIQAVAEFEAEQLGIVRSASFDDAKNAQARVEGRVRMDRNFALDAAEVAAGHVLTCQAHPLTERVVLSFDER